MAADTTEELICPSCGQPFAGAPATCSACGADLRGIGASTDTLSGVARQAHASGWGPAPGSVIDKRYRIVEKLGEGGMGAVFKVEHVRMGKILALKLMRAEAALDRVAVKRFHQEARLVSKLSHPNTVSVFDFGELEDGSLYMAMEYVPGRDLATLLAEDGSFPEKRAIAVTMQVLRSLAEAHDAGIIHRDVKPANVMLLRTREGEDYVKVVDFGIAKLAEARRGSSERKVITGGADFVGTPNYMSPEQVGGDDLDARSDLYSVGALLFELVTGKCLFDGDTPLAVATKHLTTKPPSPRDVVPGLELSAALEAVIERALEKDPRRRFQSADEMRAALAAARAPGTRPPSADLTPFEADMLAGGLLHRADWDRFERNLRWKRRVAPVLALLVVAALGAGAWHLFLRPRHGPRLPVTAEVEPNDGPRTANFVATDSEVRGFIQRPARDQADRDLFEFSVPGPEPMQVALSASGVPNVNLALDLFRLPEDASSRERLELPNVAQVDDTFLGGGEAMTDLRLEPGRYLARVEDRRRASEGKGTPRENTLDPYVLRVALSPLPRFYESEPNNTLDEAMRLGAARPVFGRAGVHVDAERVQTATGERLALGAPWSDDYYELVLPRGATTGCVVLTGVRGATLHLATIATEHPRIRAIADPGARQRALSDHLARQLRERPVRVEAGEVDKRCARAAESIVFKVSVAAGASDEGYVLAAVDDSENGFSGVLSACEELVARGDAELCRRLLTRAIQALPVSKSVEAARGFLAGLP